jgi:hypothetical protein
MSTTMTDDELLIFVGVKGKEGAAKFLASLTPEKRALYDRMKQVEIEAALWVEGLGPKPEGVLIDTVRDTNRRKAWR